MNNYKELIEVVKEYMNTEFWKYISGDNFFRINDKEKIYVSILGQENIDYSVNFYIGDDELCSQVDIAYGEYQTSPDSYNRLTCYKINLKDVGNLLMPDEKKILKKNHLDLNMVALRLSSGKLPRLVNEEEALMLKEYMLKIIDIANYYIDKKLKQPSDLFLDKMYVFDVSDKVTHKVSKFPKLIYKKEKIKKLNKDILNKVLILKQKGTYVASLLFSPIYISEEKEYTYMIILLDADSGIIKDIKLFKLSDRLNFQNELIGLFDKHKIYPKNIVFNGIDVLYLCDDLIKELKINFKVDNNIKVIYDIWLDLYRKN